MMKMLPGRMDRVNIRCMSGASCNFAKRRTENTAEIKAVVQVYRSLFCLSVDKRKRGLEYGS